MSPRPFAVLLVFALTMTAAQAGEAPRHQAMVRLYPAAHRIEAVATVTLPAGAAARFQLAPRLVPTRLEVDGREVPLHGRDGVWTLPAGVRGFTVRYAGTLPPPLAEPGRRAAADMPLIGPEGSYLPAWSGWLPDVGADRVTFAIEVSVPEPQVVVATGRPDGETRQGGRYAARFVSEHPGEPPSLFAGPYRIVERSGEGPLLRAYLHPELTEDLGRDYLDYSAGIIARFAERIGPYPFGAFHIVSAPLPVWLGFPGMTYIDRRILPLPFIKGQSLAHEILHNWWGNSVVPRYEGGNWAEGLTTYMADYGLADADRQRAMRLNWLRDYAALPPERDHPVVAFRSKKHDAAQVVGYNKVAFIFHMLRRELGDHTFDGAIRKFWHDHAHAVAGWTDLRRAFEAAAGRKLDGFFRQWLERPGAPSLRLASAVAERGDGGWRTTVTLTQEAPYYDVKVPLVIETAGRAEPVHLDMAGGDGTATFVTEKEPTAVAVDPNYDLFRRLAPGEAPPAMRDVTLAQEAGVVIAAEAEARPIAAELSERLLDRPGRVLTPDGTAGYDGPLLIIGTPALLSPLLDTLGLDQWMEEPDTGGATGRAWVARRGNQAVLVVSAADAAALKALSRPLPHYGRESWIVFDGSKALRTGNWEVIDNPLRRVVTVRRTD